MTQDPGSLSEVFNYQKCCAVPGCNNTEASTDIHFFPFPLNSDRCLQWLLMCNRRDLIPYSVHRLNRNFSICSTHFTPTSFVKHHKKLLKITAVPTLLIQKDEIFYQGTDDILDANSKENVSVLLQEDNHFADSNLEETFLLENDSLTSTRSVDIVIEDSQFTLNICRLCSESNFESRNMYSIFDGSDISERINSCLPLTVTPADVLPKNICMTCHKRLEKHFEFHQTVVESDNVLKEMFEQFLQNSTDDKSVKEKKNNNDIIINSVWNDHIYAEVASEGSNNHSVSGDINDSNSFLMEEQNKIVSSVDACSSDKLSPSGDVIIESEESICDDVQIPVDANNKVEVANMINYVGYGYEDGTIILGDANYMLVCNVCSGLAPDLDSLYAHSIVSHVAADGTYQCVLCDVKGFAEEENLLNHMNFHQFSVMESSDITESSVKPQSKTSEELKYVDKNKCNPNLCRTLSDIKRHLSKLFHCDFCNKRFKSKHRLDFHIKFHVGEEPGLCTHCNKKFGDENLLYRHISKYHRGLGGCCSICSRPFSTATARLAHEERRHGVQRSCLHCPHCYQAFAVATELTNHLLTEHGESTVKLENIQSIYINRLYQCEYCFKLFTKTLALEKHRYICHADNPVYTCRFCDENFPTHDDLFRHISSTSEHHISHKKVDYPERPVARKLFCCQFCSRMFQTLNNLMSHMLRHTAENGAETKNMTVPRVPKNADDTRPYKCTYCNKGFLLKTTLITHTRIHTGEKPFNCDVCGKSFTQMSGLTIHSKIHVDERPYNCSLCSQTFKIKGDRDQHQRKHSGDRPFQCTTCHKTFMTQNVYSQHCKIHTNHRPYVCKICGDAFRRSHVLRVHTLRHSGEKPHGCSLCAKHYRQRGDLVKHMRVQHGLTGPRSTPSKIGT